MSSVTKKRILVVQSGWVLIGSAQLTENNGVMGYRVTSGAVIEQWGTTRGLGQIAIEGPTDKTMLREFGDAFVPVASVLFVIDCRK